MNRIVTPEGVRYEITQTGSGFLEEFARLKGDLLERTVRRDQDDLNAVFQGVIKDQVTVVLPVLNEEKAIGEVITEVKSAGYRNILVLDGYSKDETASIAGSMGVTVIFQHGAGKAGAVKTAIEDEHTIHLVHGRRLHLRPRGHMETTHSQSQVWSCDRGER